MVLLSQLLYPLTVIHEFVIRAPADGNWIKTVWTTVLVHLLASRTCGALPFVEAGHASVTYAFSVFGVVCSSLAGSIGEIWPARPNLSLLAWPQTLFLCDLPSAFRIAIRVGLLPEGVVVATIPARAYGRPLCRLGSFRIASGYSLKCLIWFKGWTRSVAVRGG